jgi:hypothetical protein
MSTKEQFSNTIIDPITVTIPSGTSESNAIDCYGVAIKTIILPATFTGTELTFKISPDGINYFDYYRIDNLIASITCTQNRAYGLGAIDFFSVRFVKLVSNAVESADRVITILTKPL